jgi:uncharacterized protein YcbK (DUF882 family)
VTSSLFSDSGIVRGLSADRRLSLYSLSFKEGIEIEYCSSGAYVPEALSAIDRLLRDPFSGGIAPIDPKLLDLLYELHSKLGATGPFTVVCGYRSPKTNAALRLHNPAVAERSLHMEGKAVDIRLSGVPLEKLRRTALELKAGGVGYYPRSGFVHVDVGPLRTW